LSPVAFVSKNSNDFDAKKLLHLASGYNVNLKYYQSISSLQDELSPFRDDLVRKAWQKENESAKSSLNSARASLESFLFAQFVKSENVTLDLLEINDVRVAWVDKVTKKLERVPFEAVVTASFTSAGFEIDRGITVNGWAIVGAGGYERFDFESAFISQ
jgi:tetrahydrodipicolinate N-succinyltransferase